MIAFSRTVPNAWSEHDKLAKNTPGGLGIHAAILDRDIGPLLQTQKLLNSVLFARRKGHNAVDRGRARDDESHRRRQRVRHGHHAAGVAPAGPHCEFLPAVGYERNPIARRTGVVAALFAATEVKMDEPRNSGCEGSGGSVLERIPIGLNRDALQIC